jgi:hypothetical protein
VWLNDRVFYRQRGTVTLPGGYQFHRAIEAFVNPIEVSVRPTALVVGTQESCEERLFLAGFAGTLIV